MQRFTMVYLTSYLLVGGVGLLTAPDLALSLLQSNGHYGAVMPRVVGMFMIVVGGFIASFVTREDYSYYTYTIAARSFIVVVLTALLVSTRDPLFAVLDGIVLVGLLPSVYVRFRRSRPDAAR